MTGRDFYAEASELADALADLNEEECAARIKDAIDGGSTASEILFDLRWEFDQLLERGGTTDRSLNARVAELRQAIDAALD